MSVPSQLLEHVAARIANRLLQNFPLEEVKISIYKQNPPMGADCKQTGIEATFLKD